VKANRRDIGVKGLHAKENKIAGSDGRRVVGRREMRFEIPTDASNPQSPRAQRVEMRAARDQVHVRAREGKAAGKVPSPAPYTAIFIGPPGSATDRVKPSHSSVLGRQIRSPLARDAFRLAATPLLDGAVIAGEQHIGNAVPAPLRGPGVVRMFEDSGPVGFRGQ
jgi:hypothetical protein